MTFNTFSEEDRKELKKLLTEYRRIPLGEKRYSGLHLSKKSDLAIKALIIIHRGMIPWDLMSSKVTRSDVVNLAIQHYLDHILNKLKETDEGGK